MAIGRVSVGEIALPRTNERSVLAFWSLVSLATVFGAIVRVFAPLSSDFPLNDGGMFYLMAQELRHNHYLLPNFTAYNGATIPFAYPPLGLYLAALLGDLTSLPLITVVRLLPPVITILTIPAFALLSAAVLKSRVQALAAVFAFAMLPRTFSWQIMGGGLTRAPGFLFAILTLWQIYLLYTRGARRFALLAILFASLTVLSHAEWAWFTAYSAALLFCFYGRSRRGILQSLGIALGTVILTTPWWATVVGYHGIAPFVAAFQSGRDTWSSLAYLLTFEFTSEPLLSLLGVLGLIGFFACLAARSYLVPCWLVTILVVQPRSSRILAMLPLAMLIGIALDQVILPGLQQAAQRHRRADISREAGSWELALPAYLEPRAPRIFLAYCLIYALVAAFSVPFTLSSLRSLPPAEREAMAWVATNTPASSRFLVLSPAGTSEDWANDRTSEWFPVLADRTSLGTVQGTEWLPGGAFARHKDRFVALQTCASEDASCLDSWAREGGAAFTHVYIAKDSQAQSAKNVGCCDQLVQALRATRDYVVVYDGPGATVFARVANQ